MNDHAAAPPSEPGLGLGAAESDGSYRVLARKYRPARFADLIGQEALVRTLSNAIRSGRVAHAFILTGVRGVGKTTTARILARALNCVGADGESGPTDDPCGVCEHCLAIAEDRHVDVIEMDAASRTGIDDIRELIEGVRYRPVSARNKVYIIDEVHMLSRQAFNGLLKTLEEPPEHVVFIFATTEIRKVPVTVLSRCQRFDLRRVEQVVLADYFAGIAEREQVSVSQPALAMIARAADGSVRDGLSLLDQAIALSAATESGGPIAVEDERVREMLGLGDRGRGFDLFEAVMTGAIAEALEILAEMHAVGADPAVVLEDLLELSHFLTRVKLTPAIAEDPATPEAERTRGRALAESLDMASLARAWQILLKGLGETRAAPHPLQAAEMVLIRLAHASSLPSPAELLRKLEGAEAPAAKAAAASPAPAAAPATASQASHDDLDAPPDLPEPPPHLSEPPLPEPETAPAVQAPSPDPESFEDLVALVRARGERSLASHLARDVRLVGFEPPLLRIEILEGAPPRLAATLQARLRAWTEGEWIVEPSETTGVESLHERRLANEAAALESAKQDPLVQAVLDSFPNAKILEVREAGGGTDDSEDSDEPERGTGTR